MTDTKSWLCKQYIMYLLYIMYTGLYWPSINIKFYTYFFVWCRHCLLTHKKCLPCHAHSTTRPLLGSFRNSFFALLGARKVKFIRNAKSVCRLCIRFDYLWSVVCCGQQARSQHWKLANKTGKKRRRVLEKIAESPRVDLCKFLFRPPKVGRKCFSFIQ